jgi:hypothetical protein
VGLEPIEAAPEGGEAAVDAVEAFLGRVEAAREGGEDLPREGAERLV